MQNQIMEIEYNTTNIDIDSLCAKYEVTKESLDWYKPEQAIVADVMPNDTNTVPIEQLSQPTSIEDVRVGMILDTVLDIKESALTKAKELLDEDGDLSPKDIKDLVAIADTVEVSLKPKVDTRPVVNILVQNLMDAKDDC